jgi:hypothetical protein
VDRGEAEVRRRRDGSGRQDGIAKLEEGVGAANEAPVEPRTEFSER